MSSKSSFLNCLSRGGVNKSRKANKQQRTEALHEYTCGARKEELEMTWEIQNFLMTLELSRNKNSSLGNPAGEQIVCKKFESGKR
jgi:hypothetical protein